MYSSFLENFKKKKKEELFTKYFIPYFDVINKEIYFGEFFTEEIIEKPKETYNKDFEKNNIHYSPIRSKEELISKKHKEFGTIKLTDEEKKILLEKRQEKLLIDELSLRFKKMLVISGFNENNYLSPNYYNYFTRPLYSRFFRPQNLQLYTLNRTSPITNSILSYSFADILIDFHIDSLLGINFDKFLSELNEKDGDSEYDFSKEMSLDESKELQIYIQLKKNLSDLYSQSKKISLLYTVDTLVKDSVKLFEDFMNALINKCEENTENIEEIESRGYNQDFNLVMNEEYERKLIELKNKFYAIKKDKSKCFILKVAGCEEYLYGDFTLSQYNCIRKKVRQKEVIKLILKSIPLYKLQPSIFNYPPILKVNKGKKANYFELLNLYKKYYPNHDIIFRIYKTTKSQKNRYLNKNINRTKYLTKFTESGDCDFPLIININTINHIFSFIKWFNEDNYCNNQLCLPYFNPLKTVRLAKTSKLGRIFKIIKNSFFSKKENTNKNGAENDNEDADDDEEETDNFAQEKLIKKYDSLKKENKEIEKQLNYLKMSSYYQNETYNSVNNSIFNFSVTQTNYSIILDQLQNRDQDPALIRGKVFSNGEEEIKFVSHNNAVTSNYNYISTKYKCFLLENHPEELPLPVYVRVKLYLLYGSYCLQKFQTQPYLIKDFIQINEKVIFNDKDNHCLISHLPLETRIGIRIKGYDQKLNKGFILGTCQIPLYNDNGEMQSGIVDYILWPNVKIFPRVNISTPFARKFVPKSKKKEMINKYEKEIKFEKKILIQEREKIFSEKEKEIKKEEELREKQRLILGENNKVDNKYAEEEKEKKEIDYEKEMNSEMERLNNDISIINSIYNNMTKIAIVLWDIIKLEKEEILLNLEKRKLKKESEKRGYDSAEQNNYETIKKRNTIYISKDKLNTNIKIDNEKNIEELYDMSEYAYISIKFPSFSSPLIRSVPNQDSFRRFLDIKYKHQKNNNENDYDEIRKLFGDSQKEIKSMINKFEDDIVKKSTILKKESENEKRSWLRKNNLKEDKYPSDIRKYLQKSFSNIIKILKKDPLEKLEEEEIISILICRDYICTVPSALELFLRAIDWRNPLEVHVAHTYLKKWIKIDYTDAISLLDARFPDTIVREYAVNRLRDFSDDVIDNSMQILCQCLLYETFLINPLSDFLIERSLMNPSLIGNDFIWYNRVNMKNPLFEERLSAYSLQLLMIVGDKFVNDLFREMKMNYFLQITQELYLDNTKEKKKTGKEVNFLKKYFNNFLIKKKFILPIHPTFKCFKINKFDFSFIEFTTREPNKGNERRVKLKIGNDYRQEAFIVQILRIIDHLWLNNNLDLKLITYRVFPTDLNVGYIEFINSTSLNVIKNSSGVGGTLDREIIIKHLRCVNSDESSYEINYNDKTDNFIKSLAGYCVATCVLGVANRVTRNLLIKSNGIFFHADFSRILGNFKKTLGIKKERSKFLLTPEMANVYIFEQKEKDFKKFCVKAFNVLRYNASRLINLFIIMSTAGMSSFLGISDIQYIKQMLVLETPNDEDAGNYFIEEIRKCKNERLRQLDFLLQNLKL